MQTRHVPGVNGRYWTAILLASVAGTNAGDLYAHHSALGTGQGLLPLLAVLVAAFVAEPRDRSSREAYYWFAIIVLRTGATNIGDFAAYRLRIPVLVLALGLVALIAVLGRDRPAVQQPSEPAATKPPDTNLAYWTAMLAAGVFGTVVGDFCSGLLGQGPAGLALAILLPVALKVGRKMAPGSAAAYWTAVLVARTAGTCIGDWLAENRTLGLGLPLATLLSGTAFVAVLALWRDRHRVPLVAA